MKKLVILTLAITLACTYQAQGQLLKKIGKAVENVGKKIDETLGTDKNKTDQKEKQESDTSQQQPQPQEEQPQAQVEQPKVETATQQEVAESQAEMVVTGKTDLEELNLKGNVASVTETRGNVTTVYNFNKDGMFTSINHSSKLDNGKLLNGTIKFTYNDKGQLEKREENFPVDLYFTGYKESVGSETFKYNDAGRLIERNVSSKRNGKIDTEKEVYIYNAKGQLITKKKTSTRGEMSDWNYVYNAAGNLTEIFMGDFLYEEYIYNLKNQLIYVQESGMPLIKVEYNENGDCIKKSGKDLEDVEYVDSFTYTYDTQKNWTKTVEVYSSEYGELTYTTTRKIVYNQ